jgi:hypothetical protein
MSKFIKEFRDTGPVVLNLEMVIRKWNRLWYISQWKDEFRLVKFKQKNSPNTTLKVTISKEQTDTLIDILGLEKTQSEVFNSGGSWRKPEHNE